MDRTTELRALYESCNNKLHAKLVIELEHAVVTSHFKCQSYSNITTILENLKLEKEELYMKCMPLITIDTNINTILKLIEYGLSPNLYFDTPAVYPCSVFPGRSVNVLEMCVIQDIPLGDKVIFFETLKANSKVDLDCRRVYPENLALHSTVDCPLKPSFLYGFFRMAVFLDDIPLVQYIYDQVVNHSYVNQCYNPMYFAQSAEMVQCLYRLGFPTTRPILTQALYDRKSLLVIRAICDITRQANILHEYRMTNFITMDFCKNTYTVWKESMAYQMGIDYWKFEKRSNYVQKMYVLKRYDLKVSMSSLHYSFMPEEMKLDLLCHGSLNLFSRLEWVQKTDKRLNKIFGDCMAIESTQLFIRKVQLSVLRALRNSPLLTAKSSRIGDLMENVILPKHVENMKMIGFRKKTTVHRCEKLEALKNYL